MKLLVQFDVNADVIDVPQSVVEQKDLYRSRFYKWLSNESVRHSYWVTFQNGSRGLRFRSEAFVQWLNKKILRDSEEKAVIVRQYVAADEYADLPSIFF